MLALASCEEGFQHWTHLPWTTYDRMDFLGCALMSNAEYCNCRLLALLFAFLLRRLVEIAFIGGKKKKITDWHLFHRWYVREQIFSRGWWSIALQMVTRDSTAKVLGTASFGSIRWASPKCCSAALLHPDRLRSFQTTLLNDCAVSID